MGFGLSWMDISIRFTNSENSCREGHRVSQLARFPAGPKPRRHPPGPARRPWPPLLLGLGEGLAVAALPVESQGVHGGSIA